MLIINRRFQIGAHPDNRDVITKKLNEFDCLCPDIHYYKTEICGHEVTKVYIDDVIDADKLNSLIDWLRSEIKGVVSITF